MMLTCAFVRLNARLNAMYPSASFTLVTFCAAAFARASTARCEHARTQQQSCETARGTSRRIATSQRALRRRRRAKGPNKCGRGEPLTDGRVGVGGGVDDRHLRGHLHLQLVGDRGHVLGLQVQLRLEDLLVPAQTDHHQCHHDGNQLRAVAWQRSPHRHFATSSERSTAAAGATQTTHATVVVSISACSAEGIWRDSSWKLTSVVKWRANSADTAARMAEVMSGRCRKQQQRQRQRQRAATS